MFASQRLFHQLSPVQRKALDKMLRVNHAGETGAALIYKGQLAVLGSTPFRPLLQSMYEHEMRHLDTFNALLKKYHVTPTVLLPVWRVAGWTLGWSTARMGKEGAMMCTEAVETAVEKHYAAQIKELRALQQNSELNEIIQVFESFRQDELNHLETAVKHDAKKVINCHGRFISMFLGTDAHCSVMVHTKGMYIRHLDK